MAGPDKGAHLGQAWGRVRDRGAGCHAHLTDPKREWTRALTLFSLNLHLSLSLQNSEDVLAYLDFKIDVYLL